MVKKEDYEKRVKKAWNNADMMDNNALLAQIGIENKYIHDYWDELPPFVQDHIVYFVKKNNPNALDRKTKYIDIKKRIINTDEDPELYKYYCSQREGNWEWVPGYRKKDGTWVRGFCRNVNKARKQGYSSNETKHGSHYYSFNNGEKYRKR